ncbi:MAG TPA: D-glycerate dehydrogenase [Spirochaetia bacterium]|nr:D-glycerate dehydrogenase [Spirochaetia bacterium]
MDKVYITRKIPGDVLAYLAAHCSYELWPEEDMPVPRAVLLEKVRPVRGLYTLLTDRIDEEVFHAAPDLKVVANMAVGYDNIDLAQARARGILVTNTPDVLTDATADLTMALMLMTARRVLEANHVLLAGGWRTWSPMFMAGLDVHGRTLGIVGLGRIGRAVAKRARGFDMDVLYYSRTRRPAVEQELGLTYCPLAELLARSDIVTLHTNLTGEAHHLIGEAELALMKKEAILINTARGAVVDEKALYRALVAGQIWGAGLDVFEEEPVPPVHPLVSLPNVVALPHIGSATVSTRTAMAMLAAQNLVLALEGQVPPNLVGG